jgi:hypothetical protein
MNKEWSERRRSGKIEGGTNRRIEQIKREKRISEILSLFLNIMILNA